VAKRRARIIVAAGTNGAGKSSVVGAFLLATVRAISIPISWPVSSWREASRARKRTRRPGNPGYTRCNERSPERGFCFRNDAGGSSIARELHRAIDAGLDVRVFYFGLASPECTSPGYRPCGARRSRYSEQKSASGIRKVSPTSRLDRQGGRSSCIRQQHGDAHGSAGLTAHIPHE